MEKELTLAVIEALSAVGKARLIAQAHDFGDWPKGQDVTSGSAIAESRKMAKHFALDHLRNAVAELLQVHEHFLRH